MTLNEFNELSPQRRSDIVWEWGFFITREKKGSQTTILFSLNDFFVKLNIKDKENTSENIIGITQQELSTDKSITIRKADKVKMDFVNRYLIAS